MNSLCRLFGALVLLCLASLALFLAGCGSSSSKSNQPLNITAGTWTITSTQTGGGGSATITATFTTFPCSNTNIALGPDWTIPGPLTAATVCLTATPVLKSGGSTPEGLIIGVAANPVPANGTTTMVAGTSFYADRDSSSKPDAYDLTGTITASTKGISGTFTCDAAAPNCSGQTGTFSGTMK